MRFLAPSCSPHTAPIPNVHGSGAPLRTIPVSSSPEASEGASKLPEDCAGALQWFSCCLWWAALWWRGATPGR